MKIIFFAHPLFLGSHSMSRFATMLAKGMEVRGHQTEIWRPKAFFSNLPIKALRKWFGYVDQYLVFPLTARLKRSSENADTLYVLTDHALGPYAPLVSKLPHVIHCHDFLAQRSALGQIIENPTSATGQAYQKYIRQGYSRGKNFISVSERTKADLEQFLGNKPRLSEMVYNGLSPDFTIISKPKARNELGKTLGLDLSRGYLLHVGGNQWYKNRTGVLLMYEAWRKSSEFALPILMIGEEPNAELFELKARSSYSSDIHFLSGIDDVAVRTAYAGAALFLFPSLAEGFGWPIAEAMASGTLVITTNEAPMTEVAGDAAFLIDRMPQRFEEKEQWALKAAVVMENALTLNDEGGMQQQRLMQHNVERFQMNKTLDKIEKIYLNVLKNADSQ